MGRSREVCLLSNHITVDYVKVQTWKSTSSALCFSLLWTGMLKHSKTRECKTWLYLEKKIEKRPWCWGSNKTVRSTSSRWSHFLSSTCCCCFWSIEGSAWGETSSAALKQSFYYTFGFGFLFILAICSYFSISFCFPYFLTFITTNLSRAAIDHQVNKTKN
jgi:hypothetical protein